MDTLLYCLHAPAGSLWWPLCGHKTGNIYLHSATAAAACRDRRNVANTLLDTRAVLSTLEGLVGCILHAAAVFAYGAIFGINIAQILISLSSVLITFAFIFGNSMRTVYESVVFLFVVHPYQVGGAHSHICSRLVIFCRHALPCCRAVVFLHMPCLTELSHTARLRPAPRAALASAP